MSTPTPRTYAAKTKSGFAAVPDQFYEFARTLETELSALRAEVERLRSDRDCEKRLRKDADEFRENATERAQRAEADLAAERKKVRVLHKALKNIKNSICRIVPDGYSQPCVDESADECDRIIDKAMKEDAK